MKQNGCHNVVVGYFFLKKSKPTTFSIEKSDFQQALIHFCMLTTNGVVAQLANKKTTGIHSVLWLGITHYLT